MVRKDGRLDGEEDGEAHSKMRFWEYRLEDRVYPLQKKAADRWDSSWWWWWESQWSTRRWRWWQVCRWDPPERATFQVMSLMPQNAIYVKVYLSVFTKEGRNTVPAYLPIYLEQGRNIGFIFIYSANVSKCLFCITLSWGRWTRCIPCFTEPTVHSVKWSLMDLAWCHYGVVAKEALFPFGLSAIAPLFIVRRQQGQGWSSRERKASFWLKFQNRFSKIYVTNSLQEPQPLSTKN